MSDLIGAELLKLRTIRVFWGYVLVGLALVPLTIALTMTTAGEAGPTLAGSEGVRNVLSAASSAALILLLLGVMVVAGEVHHGTLTSTFLVRADRTRVVAAKVAATSVVAVVTACAASALALAVGLPWLALRGVDVGAYGSAIGLAVLGALAATTLSAVIGVGIGALVRNQNVAVTGVLVWTVGIETLLVTFVPEIGRWLPGGASSALTGVATPERGLLAGWAGALVLAAYATAFVAAGARVLVRRDVG